MPDLERKNIAVIWFMLIAVIIALLLANAYVFNWSPLIWIPISIFIFVGIIISFMKSTFFEPKKKCPKCGTPAHSVYTETCTNCGLQLIIKCPACAKYLNTYTSGKPVKYCGLCGLKLKKTLELKEIIVHDSYILSDKARFCPNCGETIEEENPNYCSLCGAKID